MTIFMIIGALKFMFLILNSLSKFGEVRYMRFALTAFEHLWITRSGKAAVFLWLRVKLQLLVLPETVWHFVSKERLGIVRALRNWVHN